MWLCVCCGAGCVMMCVRCVYDNCVMCSNAVMLSHMCYLTCIHMCGVNVVLFSVCNVFGVCLC